MQQNFKAEQIFLIIFISFLWHISLLKLFISMLYVVFSAAAEVINLLGRTYFSTV